MIPKLFRFHRRGSLNFVYRKGRTVRGEFMSLRYVQSRSKDYRLAVVVSKKVSKSAVVRNRIRRRIYEVVRLYKVKAGVEWPYDLVITVFDDRVAEMPPVELEKLIAGLLQKADVDT